MSNPFMFSSQFGHMIQDINFMEKSYILPLGLHCLTFCHYFVHIIRQSNELVQIFKSYLLGGVTIIILGVNTVLRSVHNTLVT